jgi:protein subunit release factor A
MHHDSNPSDRYFRIYNFDDECILNHRISILINTKEMLIVEEEACKSLAKNLKIYLLCKYNRNVEIKSNGL